MTGGVATAPRRLRAEPLTAAAFAPYGALVAIDAAGGRSVNQGRGRRIAGIGDLAHDAAAMRPVLDLYRIEPSPLPFAPACFERHVLTSQVFIPIRCARLLLAVAPDDSDGQPDLKRSAAFVAQGDVIIHYRAGAWHSPLVALDEPAVLSMLMWEVGDSRDCEEASPATPIEIVT